MAERGNTTPKRTFSAAQEEKISDESSYLSPSAPQDRFDPLRANEPRTSLANASRSYKLGGPPAFFAVLCVLTTVVALFTLMIATPLSSGSFNYPLLIAGALLVGFLGYAAYGYRKGTSLPVVATVVAVCLLALTAYILGSALSPRINGKIYPITSQEAKAYTLAHQIQTDLTTLKGYAPLVTLSLPEGQANQGALSAASTASAQMSVAYAKTAADPPAFQTAVNDTSDAAYWLAQATQTVVANVLQPDAANTNKIEKAMTNYNTAYVAAYLANEKAATQYHIVLTSPSQPPGATKHG